MLCDGFSRCSRLFGWSRWWSRRCEDAGRLRRHDSAFQRRRRQQATQSRPGILFVQYSRHAGGCRSRLWHSVLQYQHVASALASEKVNDQFILKLSVVKRKLLNWFTCIKKKKIKWTGRVKKKRIADGSTSTAVEAAEAAQAEQAERQMWPGGYPIRSVTTSYLRTPFIRTIRITRTMVRYATIGHLWIWTQNRWGSPTIRSCIPAFRPLHSAGGLLTLVTTAR